MHNFFKFPIDKEKVHSRCSKCNNEELILISKEEAIAKLKWEENEENKKY